MTLAHDVCRDPLEPSMRERIDRAADAVLRQIGIVPRPAQKPLTPRDFKMRDLLKHGVEPENIAERFGIDRERVYEVRARLRERGYLP